MMTHDTINHLDDDSRCGHSSSSDPLRRTPEHALTVLANDGGEKQTTPAPLTRTACVRVLGFLAQACARSASSVVT